MPVATDEAFGALADATRLDIVMRLSRGAASVSELAEPHAMSLRAVLKHVQVLETLRLGEEHEVRLLAAHDFPERVRGAVQDLAELGGLVGTELVQCLHVTSREHHEPAR